MNERKKRKRLVVVGIDGGTFTIIDPLIQAGKLPNLAAMKNRAVLTSTIPPGTGVAWASFSTGNRPGKTNIYDFTIVEDNSWKIKFVNRGLLSGKPLWKYLDEAGLKCCFMNIPITYPPEKINGVMISGIDAPSTLSNYVSPPELKQKLKEFNYEIEVSGLKEKNELPKQAIEVLDNRARAAHYFLEQDFDFFVVLFRESDVVQHFAWGMPVVEEVYTKIDNFIGDVRKKIEKEGGEIIIMSDHGHENVTRAFNVNAWLEQEGYLTTHMPRGSFLGSIGINRERIFKILEKMQLQFLVKMVPRKLGKKIPSKEVDFEEAIINNFVDFSKTKAIAKRAVKTSQIFLNTRARGGIVEKEDEESMKQEIKNKLGSFLSDKKISAVIKTKEEIYGTETKYAPDITLYMKEKHYDTLSLIKSQKKIWDATKEQATHTTEGIIFSTMDLNLKNPEIIDLAPTILEYFGIKNGKFDGKSLII